MTSPLVFPDGDDCKRIAAAARAPKRRSWRLEEGGDDDASSWCGVDTFLERERAALLGWTPKENENASLAAMAVVPRMPTKKKRNGRAIIASL